MGYSVSGRRSGVKGATPPKRGMGVSLKRVSLKSLGNWKRHWLVFRRWPATMGWRTSNSGPSRAVRVGSFFFRSTPPLQSAPGRGTFGDGLSVHNWGRSTCKRSPANALSRALLPGAGWGAAIRIWRHVRRPACDRLSPVRQAGLSALNHLLEPPAAQTPTRARDIPSAVSFRPRVPFRWRYPIPLSWRQSPRFVPNEPRCGHCPVKAERCSLRNQWL